MIASGIFLPFCLPWLCWWRLLYFSPSELDQQDWQWERFSWVHLTGTGQKTLRSAAPMAGLQRGDWSACGSAWGCTSGTEGRLDGAVSSMDGDSLFSTPRVIITIINDRFQRTLQTKLSEYHLSLWLHFYPYLDKLRQHLFCAHVYIHTHMHTAGCTDNKTLINKAHYMYGHIVIYRLIK